MAIKIFYKTILLGVVIVYIGLLMRLLFFNVGATDRQSYFTEREIHFVPLASTFHSIEMAQDFYEGPKQTAYYWYLAIRNIFGNMLLFMPVGMLMPIIKRNFSLKALIAAAFFLSFFAEVVQYVFVLGVSDIDDIIYNVLGAMIGFTLYVVIKKLFDKNKSVKTQ